MGKGGGGGGKSRRGWGGERSGCMPGMLGQASGEAEIDGGECAQALCDGRQKLVGDVFAGAHVQALQASHLPATAPRVTVSKSQPICQC